MLLSVVLEEEVAAELEAPPVGTVLEGRYELIEPLGEGGVGWVYRARHLRLGTEVAVKMLQTIYDHQGGLRPRFDREAKALAALRHPNIVTLTDYSIADGRPYLVMELLEGLTLSDVLVLGPVPEARARRIARQTLEALEYAHSRGFAHRDMKPSNIFLVNLPSDPDHVKILDFGFVKTLDKETTKRPGSLTRSGIAFGTPGYMCPEQATGATTDLRGDLYAMGVVLFEMLSGRRPFVGEIPEVVRAHLTDPVPSLSVGGAPIEAGPQLARFFERALAKSPNDRFQTAQQMREALDALPTPALASSRSTSERPPSRTSSPDEITLSQVDAQKAPERSSSTGRWLLLSAMLVAGGALAWKLGPELARNDSTRSAAPSIEEPMPPSSEPTAIEEPMPPSSEPAVIAEPTPELAPSQADAREPAPSADPWSAREPNAFIASAHRRVLAGEALSSEDDRMLRQYVRLHRDDPRPHLVLAQDFVHRGQWRSALERYSLAHRVDANARHDPRMMPDLVRLSASSASDEAGELLIELYGADSLVEIERVLMAGELDRPSRVRLESLVPRLRARR